MAPEGPPERPGGTVQSSAPNAPNPGAIGPTDPVVPTGPGTLTTPSFTPGVPGTVEQPAPSGTVWGRPPVQSAAPQGTTAAPGVTSGQPLPGTIPTAPNTAELTPVTAPTSGVQAPETVPLSLAPVKCQISQPDDKQCRPGMVCGYDPEGDDEFSGRPNLRQCQSDGRKS